MESKAHLLDVSQDWKTGRFRLTFLVDKKLDQSTIDSMDGDIRLRVVKWREKRSLNANAYFHVLCQKIAEKTESSITEIKNHEIAEYGQLDKDIGPVILKENIEWQKIEYMHLYPTTQTRVLDDKKLYRVYLVMRGSHTYDTKEMARLIDGTINDAKELGIETATPSELERMKNEWRPE